MCLTILYDQDYDGSMSLQKLFCFIVYLLEDEYELSLGMLIRLKRIYNFFMFHVDIIPIVTCFTYTSYHFYTFSGTNLLTRCHSASSYFLLFLYSRKASLEIFSELDKKLRRTLFYQKTHGVRRRGELEPRGPHTWARRDQGSAGAQGWCRLLVHRLATPFGLYIAPTPKTLKHRAFHREHIRCCRRRQP